MILADAVKDAIAEILADIVEIPCGEVALKLPEHVRRGNPTKKLIGKTVLEMGWSRFRMSDGSFVYRAPRMQSDPLIRPGEGHNIAADELRTIIERRERLEEEKKGIGDDIKDLMTEAKSRGYDAKAINKIIAIRKLDPSEYQESQAILDVYLNAMGMA